MLLVRLVLDLLARRAAGAPVPLLVSVASWDPRSQDLHSWLAGQMTVDHPSLRAPVIQGAVSGSRAAMLIAQRFIVPVLDGLDEMPEHLWGAAIAGINRTLRPGEGAVLASRTDSYEAAVRWPGGVLAPLHGAGVIELMPVDPAAAGKYLVQNEAGTGRWSPVLAALGTASPTGRALSTPLMLSLAREIYGLSPELASRQVLDPEELCSKDVTSREMVEERLLDAFIPSAYRDRPSVAEPSRNSWGEAEARQWFAFIASHLERVIKGPGFAWWQLECSNWRLVTRAGAVIAGGVGFALTLVVLSGSPAQVGAKVLAAVGAGAVSGLIIWWQGNPQRPITKVGWSLRFAARLPSLLAGKRGFRPVGIAQVFVGVTFPVILVLNWLVFGLAAEPAWLLVGLAAAGIHGVYEDLTDAATPRAVLTGELRSMLVLAAVAAVYSVTGNYILGTAVGRVVRAVGSIADAPALGAAAGLGFGAALALGLGLTFTSYLRFRLAAAWLAACRKLPWRLITFLEDGHTRGVLRYSGADYQFRHIELQHQLGRLPGLPANPAPHPGAPGRV
jgi:hypothetical protein